MARKKKSDLEKEAADEAAATTEPVSDENATTNIVDDSAELVDPAPVKPRRPPKTPDTPRPTKAEIAAAQPKRYEVVLGGRIMHRGALTQLRVGKTFKATDYNVPQLLLQGVELKEI